MRKNKKRRAGIRGVYTCFRLKGLNQDRFINSLKTKGIDLFDLKKSNERTLTFKVKRADEQKVFAINRNVWYNAYEISKMGEQGLSYPLLYAVRNVGVVIGILIFIAFCVISNDFILSFSFTGTGAVYERQIKDYLNEKGIAKYSRFSSFNLNELEDQLLADNDFLTFASVQKKGNVLVLDLTLSKEPPSSLSGKEEFLKSDVSGVIESIKVYRGTAIKKVGERVEVGEIIVDGFAAIKEQVVKVNVIAHATVLYQTERVYYSNNQGEETLALLFAREGLGDNEEVDYSISITKENGEYKYIVNLTNRRVLFVG